MDKRRDPQSYVVIGFIRYPHRKVPGDPSSCYEKGGTVKEVTLGLPELAMVVGTRAMAGAGVGV